ncbi:sodium/proton antiporter 1 [Tanacetum coccineum]
MRRIIPQYSVPDRLTRVLPWRREYKRRKQDDVLDWLKMMFGFQKDNVANQRGYLIYLQMLMFVKLQNPKSIKKRPTLIGAETWYTRRRISATYSRCIFLRGTLEIFSLSGSFIESENDGQCNRTGGLSVLLSRPDDRVLGGNVAGFVLWLKTWHDIHPDKKTEFVTKGRSFQFQMPIIVWDFGQIKDFLNLDSNCSLEAAGILKEIANYLDSHIPISELIASAIGVVSAIINKVPLVAAAMGMYDLSSYPRDSQLWHLEAAGILKEIANYLDSHIPSSELIASAIGVVSAIINKVPLVAAAMGMYDLSSYPRDSQLWQLV